MPVIHLLMPHLERSCQSVRLISVVRKDDAIQIVFHTEGAFAINYFDGSSLQLELVNGDRRRTVRGQLRRVASSAEDPAGTFRFRFVAEQASERIYFIFQDDGRVCNVEHVTLSAPIVCSSFKNETFSFKVSQGF